MSAEVDVDSTYRRQRVPIFNYFRRCGIPQDASEDLTQGVFIVLMEHGARFDPARGSLDVFLFGIARNLRRAWERKDRHIRDRSVHSEASPGVSAAAAEEVAATKQAIRSLPEGQREAIILREFHGLVYQEIARVQGVEVGTVRSRLARGRENLRQFLRQPERSEHRPPSDRFRRPGSAG